MLAKRMVCSTYVTKILTLKKICQLLLRMVLYSNMYLTEHISTDFNFKADKDLQPNFFWKNGKFPFNHYYFQEETLKFEITS